VNSPALSASDLRERAEGTPSIETFRSKNKDAGLEKLALLVGDVVSKGRKQHGVQLSEISFKDLQELRCRGDRNSPMPWREIPARRISRMHSTCGHDRSSSCHAGPLTGATCRSTPTAHSLPRHPLTRARRKPGWPSSCSARVPGRARAAMSPSRRPISYPHRDAMLFHGRLLEEGRQHCNRPAAYTKLHRSPCITSRRASGVS
jgi:hypothetical protein